MQDVDPAAEDEIARFLRRANHLTGREPQARQAAERHVAIEIVGAKRFLEPVDPERLERPGDLRRGGDVPAGLEIPGHAPTLVRVDHDLEVRPDGISDSLDDGNILTPVGVVKADLDGLHARVAKRDAAARALGRLDQLAARRIGDEAIRAAAEELPDGLAGHLPDQIPDGGLGDPGAAAVEVDRLTELTDDLRAEGVKADEERFEQRAIGQVIAARPARDAVVGVDADERRLLVVARNRVPGSAERWVEGHAVAARLDRADPHQPPL